MNKFYTALSPHNSRRLERAPSALASVPVAVKLPRGSPPLTSQQDRAPAPKADSKASAKKHKCNVPGCIYSTTEKCKYPLPRNLLLCLCMSTPVNTVPRSVSDSTATRSHSPHFPCILPTANLTVHSLTHLSPESKASAKKHKCNDPGCSYSTTKKCK